MQGCPLCDTHFFDDLFGGFNEMPYLYTEKNNNT